MKKPIISAILLLSLLFGLCGCKAGGKNGDGTIALSDYSGAASPTFERRDICLEGYEFTSGSDLFYDGESTVYIASYQGEVKALFRLDLETEEVTDLGYETANFIYDFDITPSDTLMILESDHDADTVLLKEVSQNGELIRDLDIGAVSLEAVGSASNGDIFLNFLTCLEDEILFFADSGAFTTDYDGNLLQSVEAMMYPLGIYRNANGKAVLFGRDADGYVFLDYNGDLNNMDKTKLPWDVIFDPCAALDGYGSKGLYFGVKTDIVSLDYHTGEAELVVDSTTNTYTSAMAFISPDKFITSEHTAYVDEEPTNICSIWERVSDDDTTVLKMATYGASYELTDAVSTFNAQNSNVKIKLVDYSTYDLSGESGDGLTKLNTEIIAGDIPDLFDLGTLYEDTYANKGLLENLDSWLDGPNGPSRDQLVEPVISALERENGLYSIPAYFKVSAVVGSSELLSGEGWTPEEFLAFAEEHGADKMFPSQMTGNDFMDYVITFTAEDYMDRDAGTCDFDNEGFINMLKFAARLPVEEPSIPGDQSSEVAEGKCLLILRVTGIPMEELEMWNALFGGEAEHKGFPSTHGTGICARVSNRVGMSSASQHKDEAWAFISWMLSDEFQSQLHRRNAIPMSASQMEHDFRQVIEKSNGQPQIWEIYIDDVPTDLTCDPASEDTYNEAMSLINRIDCIDQCDGNISKIVMEECSYLFSGAKTAEETAKLIQERVSLYMAEQG